MPVTCLWVTIQQVISHASQSLISSRCVVIEVCKACCLNAELTDLDIMHARLLISIQSQMSCVLQPTMVWVSCYVNLNRQISGLRFLDQLVSMIACFEIITDSMVQTQIQDVIFFFFLEKVISPIRNAKDISLTLRGLQLQ